MKKILLLLSILFSISTYGQTVNYGITAGLNYTNLSGNGDIYYSSNKQYLVGFRAGGLIDIGYKAFSIQPGVLFAAVGGQEKDPYPDINGTTTYIFNKVVLDYVEIPVNFLFRTKARNGSFFIGGGPYAALAISGKLSYGVYN